MRKMILLTCTSCFVLHWSERICVRCFWCFLWGSFSHDRMIPSSHSTGLMKGKYVIIPNDRILFWRVQMWYHIASGMLCVCVCMCVCENSLCSIFCITLNCSYLKMNGRVLFFFYNSSSVCYDFQYSGTSNGREVHQSHMMFKDGNIERIFLLSLKAFRLVIWGKIIINRK